MDGHRVQYIVTVTRKVRKHHGFKEECYAPGREGLYFSTSFMVTSETSKHRLNMESDLQSVFGLLCTLCSLAETPATSPLLPHLGSYTTEKIDDISL
jgi:hypothetical protein